MQSHIEQMDHSEHVSEIVIAAPIHTTDHGSDQPTLILLFLLLILCSALQNSHTAP